MDQNQPKQTPHLVIKKKWYEREVRSIFLISLVIFGIFIIVSIANATKPPAWIEETSKKPVESRNNVLQPTVLPSPTEAPLFTSQNEIVETKKEATQEPTQQIETSKTETKNEPSIPPEYRSALRKAASYANTLHMSKTGIYDQLVSEYGEKFSPEAAQYAIDNVIADWNANALAKAKNYQDTMSMSPDAIRSQLVSSYGEKFTEAEADYAIQHLNE